MSPFVFSKDLPFYDFQKFTDAYVMTAEKKKLGINTKLGMYYIADEWGDAQISWQGDNTFTIHGCTTCRIVFTLNDQR